MERTPEGVGVPDAIDSLLDLPQEILADNRGPKDRTRRVQARLRRILAGEPLHSDSEQPATDVATPARRGPTAHLTAAAIHRHLSNANVSRAASCLDAAPISEATPPVLQRLQDLHPPEPPPHVPLPDEPALTIREEDLARVLRRLPRGKAGGPSGWTYEHVKAAARGEACFKVILRFVNAVVSGHMPRVQRLLDCRLIPTGSLDTKIRPIAIGEVWVRITALCALAAVPLAGPRLLPLQVGVGVSGGAEIVPHVLRAALAAEPDSALLRLDFANAFNTLRRASMLRSVAERCPQLSPLSQWLYGAHTNLWVQGAPADALPVSSQSGVRQGDPLGPLLFALTLQGPLERLDERVPAAAPLALHDDVSIQGPPDALGDACKVLIEEVAPLGLHLAVHKCAATASSNAAAAAAAEAAGVPACPDGIVVSGSPIGNDEFVLRFMRDKAATVIALTEKAKSLPLAEQDRFALLRMSLSARLTYTARTAPLGQCEGEVHAILSEAAETVARAAVHALLPFREHTAERQLFLPMRYGGLGFRRLSLDEHVAAGLASNALAQSAMAQGPQQFRPLDGPGRPHAQAIWARVRELVPAISDHADVSDAHAGGSLASAQRDLSEALSQAAHEQLLADQNQHTALGQSVLSRLHSISCSQSAAWLTALPTHRALIIRSYPFLAALRRRLGETQTPPTRPGLVCFCGADLHNAGPDHLLACKATNRLTTMRHDAIRDVMRDALRRAGIGSSLEPGLAALHREAQGPEGDGVRRPRCSVGDSRGDILAVLDGAQTVYDVVVVHPGCKSHRKVASEVVGGAVERAAKRKVDHYNQWANGTYEFVPLAIETHGRLCKAFMQVLNTLGTRAEAHGRGQFTKQDFINGVCRELSVTLCVYNSMLESSAKGFYGRVAGSPFQPGLAVPSAEVGAESG